MFLPYSPGRVAEPDPEDGDDRPHPLLMERFIELAADDGLPRYVIGIHGQWLGLSYLEPARNVPAYYYVHPSGYVGYGPDAEGDAEALGINVASRQAARGGGR